MTKARCDFIAQVERLEGLLVEAYEAFEECTGDYSKELVEDEEWYLEAQVIARKSAARARRAAASNEVPA